MERSDKQRAHESLDRVPVDQMTVAVRFPEFLLHSTPIEDEEISQEEKRGVARSKQWFMQNEGFPFEQMLGEFGEASGAA